MWAVIYLSGGLVGDVWIYKRRRNAIKFQIKKMKELGFTIDEDTQDWRYSDGTLVDTAELDEEYILSSARKGSEV